MSKCEVQNKQRLEFYPYKNFNIKDRIYLYTINAGGVFEIDERTLEIIESEGEDIKQVYNDVKDKFTREEFDNLIDSMKQAKFIKTISIHDIVENSMEVQLNKKISSVTLMLVQECNLRCKYCYGEGGEYHNKGIMSQEVAFGAIDFLIENSDSERLIVAFLGGEPLLNLSLIKKVISYCRDMELSTGRKFDFTMTTNGMFINNEVENYLINNHVNVQISIDGAKEEHDRNRFDAKGRGSYNKIIKSTESMRKKYLLDARATVTKENMDLIKIFEHLESLNFKSIPISFAQNLMDDQDYEELIKKNTELILYFENLIKEGRYREAARVTIIWNSLQKINNAGVRYLPCGVASNMVTVDINGDLYPCHRFVNFKEHAVGNIFSGYKGRDRFIENINLYKHDQCQNCWVQNLCLGGCPNENYSNTGDIHISSERNCKMTKKMYEDLIEVYLRLSDEEKQIIFKNKETK